MPTSFLSEEQISGINGNISNVAALWLNPGTAVNSLTAATPDVASAVAQTGPTVDVTKYALSTLVIDVTGGSSWTFTVRGGISGIGIITLFSQSAFSSTSFVINISSSTVPFVTDMFLTITNGNNGTGAAGAGTVKSRFLLHV